MPSLIPDDFRIEVVPVHFASSATTDYEIQLRWTAREHSEVVYLGHSNTEQEAVKLAKQALVDLCAKIQENWNWRTS